MEGLVAGLIVLGFAQTILLLLILVAMPKQPVVSESIVRHVTEKAPDPADYWKDGFQEDD